ncbi:unnamed protein product [Camellia sinensis]
MQTFTKKKKKIELLSQTRSQREIIVETLDQIFKISNLTASGGGSGSCGRAASAMKVQLMVRDHRC